MLTWKEEGQRRAKYAEVLGKVTYLRECTE